MSDRLPPELRPPLDVALARSVPTIPKPGALPGGCLFEPKWDGYRLLVCRDGDATVLQSRQGKDLNRYFPDLLAAAAVQLPPGCLVDGEAVIWSEDRLDFSLLQQRLSASARSLPRQVQEKPAHFVAFDLLAVAGHDIRQEPLRDRRALLEELAKEWSGPLELSPVTADPEKAVVWFRDLPATGVEGLVIKGAGQSYDGGQRQWLKVKHRETLDVICAAVIGPMAKPQAVVAGLPIDGELRIVGRSVPLKPAAAKLLGARLQPPAGEHPWPQRVKSTAMDRFNATRGETELTLIEPIVVEVSADTAWSGQSFRHPLRYLRYRGELDPADVSAHPGNP
ncbi:ATP-dependent DNA ligase [Arthrobacter sp. VKM Ac-2550]|uniref:ATP-dependent DNA ligase n=1 Tax=Crystallibacter permensis TaxID=1938888 RepID=UPI0022272FB6|nr:ATP-dependent DNA ligase [Arthrobacter sp. VKM Ac-2550]